MGSQGGDEGTGAGDFLGTRPQQVPQQLRVGERGDGNHGADIPLHGTGCDTEMSGYGWVKKFGNGSQPLRIIQGQQHSITGDEIALIIGCDPQLAQKTQNESVWSVIVRSIQSGDPL